MAGVAVHRYAPKVINPPAIFPGSPSFEPVDQADGVKATLQLHVAVPDTLEDWQPALEEIVHGTDGLLDVLDTSWTLGLSGVSVVWTEVEGFGTLDYNGITYLGTTVTIEVNY